MSAPFYEGDGLALYALDCREGLRELADNSVDACVTDPPGGIEFMGREWDSPWAQGFSEHGFSDGGNRRPAPAKSGFSRNPNCRRCKKHVRGAGGCRCSEGPDSDEDPQFEQRRTLRDRAAFVQGMTDIFREVHRVLKPGAHGLVWGLPRTSHWIAWALEDAGLEVRDRLAHFFATGFPKSLDASKAIDKAAGRDREVVGRAKGCGKQNPAWNGTEAGRSENSLKPGYALTAPATDEAAEWDGWGTALKPACEDWWLVRKPLSEGTVAANLVARGTGALNIDGCRLDRAEGDVPGWHKSGANGSDGYQDTNTFKIHDMTPEEIQARCGGKGRWPSNVVLSHHPECVEVGTRRVRAISGGTGAPSKAQGGTLDWAPANGGPKGDAEGMETVTDFHCHPDCPVRVLNEQAGNRSAGGAPSRRFTPNTEHTYNLGFGMDCPPGIGGSEGPASRFFFTPKADAGERFLYCRVCQAARPAAERRNHRHGRKDWSHLNEHPTVKPLALARWLVRLVVPPDGLVLDPFAGTGMILAAARAEGVRAIGYERDLEYCHLARARFIGVDPALFTGSVP